MMQRLQRARSRRRRCRGPQVEQLEDRRLLSAAVGYDAEVIRWESTDGSEHGQVAFHPVTFPAGEQARGGHEDFSPGWSAQARDGLWDVELAIVIRQLDREGTTSTNSGADQGQPPPFAPPPVAGGSQGKQGVFTGDKESTGRDVAQPSPGRTDTFTPTPVVGTSDRNQVVTVSSAAPSAAPTVIASPTPEVTTVATSGTTAEPATAAPAPASAPTARPARAVAVAAATSATPVAVVAAVSTGQEPVQVADGNPAPAPHPGRLVARTGTTREPVVTTDNLTGGSAQAEVPPAFPRRAADSGMREAPAALPPTVREAVPAADRQPGGGAARPASADPAGAQQPAQPDVAPQEAGLIADLPASSVQGVGLRAHEAYRQLRNLLGDLADSVVVWRVAPVLAAALLGGGAFGLVRRRRKRRGLHPVRPGPGKHTDIWLPNPTDRPAVNEP